MSSIQNSQERNPSRVGRIWRKNPSFVDDFKAEPNDTNGCYSLSRPLYCLHAYNTYSICPGYPNDPIYQNELRDINRCTWALENFPGQSDPVGKRVMTKTFKNVEVNNGVLTLKLRTHPEFASNRNCGNDYSPPGGWGGPYDTNCPISGAQIISNPKMKPGDWIQLPGIAGKFGRYEVRAKLPDHPSTFPAIWMLPDDGPWPEAGEIDLMEVFRGEYWKADCTFHSGPRNKDGGSTQIGFDLTWKDFNPNNKRIFVDEWHTWGYEWDPEKLRFTIDDKTCMVVTRNNNKGAWMPKQTPFFWLLGIATDIAKGRDGPIDFHDDYSNYQDFRIDWVKNYPACEADTDFCDSRDEYDNSPGKERCVLEKLPQLKRVAKQISKSIKEDTSLVSGFTGEFQVLAQKVVYPVQPGGNPCPIGENGRAGILETANGVQRCVYLTRDSDYQLYREGERDIYSVPRCDDYRNLYAEYLNQVSDVSEKHCEFTRPLYPNPILMGTDTLKINFGIDKPSKVFFEVFDVAGRLVYKHKENLEEVLNKGQYELAWDTRINGGNYSASAMYIIRLQCESEDDGKIYNSTKSNTMGKVILLK